MKLELTNSLMKIFKTWTFRWWEVGMIKLCLLSLGLILGIYLKTYLADFVWLWWVIFAVTTAYFIGKMVQASDGGSKVPMSHTLETDRLTKSTEAEIPKHTEKGL